MSHQPELIHRSLDGELTPDEQERLALHLAACEECRELQAELRRNDLLLAAREPLPPVPARRVAVARRSGLLRPLLSGVATVLVALLVGEGLARWRAANAPQPVPLSAPTPSAAPVVPSPTPSYHPGPTTTSGKVIRKTPNGVVIDEAPGGHELEVDLRSADSVWKETTVPASAIEVGDRLMLNGGRAGDVFNARNVYVSIGRIDGVVLAFDGLKMRLAWERNGLPFIREVELSRYVEIVREGRSGEEPATASDLEPGTLVGMVVYAPPQSVPRATRLWITPLPASPTPSPAVVTRPLLGPGPLRIDPVPAAPVPAAGTMVVRFGGTWWYDGPTGVVARAPFDPNVGGEIWSPAGGVIAVERYQKTRGGQQIARELALRVQGVEHVIYRAKGEGFYWGGWSPDGRYVALWEIDMVSGSLDMDGRPLVVIDTQSGARTELGVALLRGTISWGAPHTLAFVSGAGRMPWDHKALKVWSPEGGMRAVTPEGVAAFSPSWSPDGRKLYFVSGPSGQWDPLEAVNGIGVGGRHVGAWSAGTGAISRVSLADAGAYAEEGVRVSRDGARLLILRRPIVRAAASASIPSPDTEAWLADVDGGNAERLFSLPGTSLGAYGYQSGPSEWDWSE